MGTATILHWLKNHCSNPVCFVVVSCFILAACQVDSDRPVTFSTPDLLRSIPAENLSLTVSIDDQAVLYQGVRREDGMWVVRISVELDTNHTAYVSWYGLDSGNRILIARQTSTFFASSETNQATLTGPLESTGAEEFDIDCDGMSNLDELNAGTDPSSGSGCATSEPTPDTPIAPVSPDDPAAIPIPETIAIEPGCFDMGSPATEPNRQEWETQHNVCINERLHVGVYEVTFDQYTYFANQPDNPQSAPYDDGMGSGRRPVKNIIWEEANSYAAWLSRVTGKNYRLLTEAEWEYAARAGTTTAYWTGEFVSNLFENVKSDGIIEVGSLGQPNPWGLHDMLGNVSEWTCSNFQADYGGSEKICDASPLVRKALRGGSFYAGASNSRSASRYNTDPTIVDGGIGFRIVMVE